MTESKIWMFVDIILDKDIATIKSGCNRLGGNIRFPHSHSERKEMYFPWTLMVMMLEVVVPSGRYAGIVVVWRNKWQIGTRQHCPHIWAPQNYPIREIWWRLPQALPALPPPGILALYTRCPHQRGAGFTVRDSFVGVFDDCLGFVPIMGVSPVVTVTR